MMGNDITIRVTVEGIGKDLIEGSRTIQTVTLHKDHCWQVEKLITNAVNELAPQVGAKANVVTFFQGAGDYTVEKTILL